MPNGKPGDHPYTDILNFGSSEYGEAVDSLVKKLAAMPGFSRVKDAVADLLWENSPLSREPERAALVRHVLEKLRAIEQELQ